MYQGLSSSQRLPGSDDDFLDLLKTFLFYLFLAQFAIAILRKFIKGSIQWFKDINFQRVGSLHKTVWSFLQLVYSRTPCSLRLAISVTSLDWRQSRSRGLEGLLFGNGVFVFLTVFLYRVFSMKHCERIVHKANCFLRHDIFLCKYDQKHYYWYDVDMKLRLYIDVPQSYQGCTKQSANDPNFSVKLCSRKSSARFQQADFVKSVIEAVEERYGDMRPRKRRSSVPSVSFNAFKTCRGLA